MRPVRARLMAERIGFMFCPKCSSFMYQPPDEDGDYACICGMRVYANARPTWAQSIVTDPLPRGRGTQPRHKKRYGLTA